MKADENTGTRVLSFRFFSFMLPRINRITKDKEYELVFKAGRSRYSDLLGVKAARNRL